MIAFEYYDADNDSNLSEECLNELTEVMNKYGYSVCDVAMDTITFIED